MIQRLNTPALAFGASGSSQYSRKAYDDLVQKNQVTADLQTKMVTSSNVVQNTNVSKQIPMQGVGENLNVIA